MHSGWDGMVENTLDPAHFCSAHHGTLGNRYDDGSVKWVARGGEGGGEGDIKNDPALHFPAEVEEKEVVGT